MALAVRWITAVALHYAVGGGVVFGDDGTYVQLASDVAEGTTSAWSAYLHELYRETASYTLVLTALYWVIGPSVLAGQLLTAVYGAAAAALTTRLGIEALPRWAAMAAGLLVALLPSQVLWSSLTLKDATSWSLLAAVALAVAGFGAARDRGMLRMWAVTVLFLVLVHFVRPHNFVIATWAFGLTGWLVSKERLRHGAAALVTAIVLPLLFGMGPGAIDFVRSQGSLEEKRALNAQNATTAFVLPDLTPDQERRLAQAQNELERGREALATASPDRLAAAAFALERARARAAQVEQDLQAPSLPPMTLDEWLDFEIDADRSGSLVDDLKHLPRGYVIMLLEPLPWRNTGNPRIDAAKFEMILWYPMLLLAVIGLWPARRHPRVLAFPIILGGGLVTVYGLAEGNFGTAFRHRGEVVWIVALLAMAGVTLLMRRVRRSTDRESDRTPERATD